VVQFVSAFLCTIDLRLDTDQTSNPEAEKRAEHLAKEHSVKTKAYSVNVTDPEAVKSNLDKVVAEFGKVDVFVANAGTGDSQPLLEQSLDAYRNLMAVNVDGPVYCAKYAGQIFKKQGFGKTSSLLDRSQVTSSMSLLISLFTTAARLSSRTWARAWRASGETLRASTL